MLSLDQNIYNRSLPRTAPKFKLWTWAGLMLTYRCSAACRFCYYCCSPDIQSPLMPVETALSAYRSLKNLAGPSARIHLTGGEPFLEWPRLAEIVTAIKAENLGPIDQIETNASWATDPAEIADRLQLLDRAGMTTLKISADPFHQEYIPIDRVRLLAHVAADILGPSRVQIRWQQYLDNPLLTAQMSPSDRDNSHIQSIATHKARFTGRSAFELAPPVAQKTIEQIAAGNCASQFLSAKGVHIDPAGNVFSGLCSGIIIGNINQTPLDELWKQFDCRTHPILDILFNKGPAGLVELAADAGYKTERLYAGSCHLCNCVRTFLYTKGNHKSILGPAQCYAATSAD